MSDTITHESADAQTSAAAPIQITAQYIKDFSFENPRAPNSLRPQSEAPRIDVNVDVQATKMAKDEEVYEVVLKIAANASSGDEPMFIAELTYGGLFILAAPDDTALRAMLLIECPRLLFPFARAIIADATRDGGFPPLLIQPVDFVSMYRQSVESGAPAATV